MNDAALIFCFWISGCNCLPDTCQAIRADDQDILNSTVLEAVQDCQPVLRAFILPNFNREDFFLSLKVDSEDHVSSKFPDNTVVTNGVVDRIDVENWIDLAQRPVLPVFDLRKDLVRHVGNETFGGLKTVDILHCLGDLSRRHTLGVHGDNLLINV